MKNDWMWVLLLLIVMAVILINGIVAGINHGYIKAYEDMKKGKIEETMKRGYPKTWVDFNVLTPGEKQ